MSGMNTKLQGFILCSLLLVLVGGHLGLATPLRAQTDCPTAIVGLQSALEQCSELNRNWACYGRTNAEALPADVRFYRPRDRQPLEALQAINVVQAGTVLMHLQIEGSQAPVEAAIFGNAVMTSENGDSNNFTLDVNATSRVCTATPPGLVVRTETGQRGRLTINGVGIELASVAFITMFNKDTMVVVNLAGNVTITINGEPVSLPLGQQVQIAGISSGQPVLLAGPEGSPYFNLAVLRFLVDNLDLHDNEIDINPQVTACGGSISYGSTVVAANVVSGQECLYTFNGKVGDVVSVNIDAIDTTLNPSVDLRGPDQHLIRSNNDIDIGDTDSLICNEGLAIGGKYTIVARPHRNATAGGFRLTLNRRTDCKAPPATCQVIGPRGQNRREGPGLDFPIVDVLPEGTQIHALRASEDLAWVEVTDGATGESGWMNTSTQLLLCDVPAPQLKNYPPVVVDPCTVENPPPECLVQPASAPESTKTPEPPPKTSPFGEP